VRRNLIIKQTLFTLALVLSCALASGQSLRFKTSYDSPKSSSSLKFETASFAGKLSADNQELVLKIKNTGQKNYTNQSLKITLTDITNRGAKLCHSGKFQLAPGDRISLSLHNCDKERGLFFLDASYPSNADFKENAFFLRGKEWKLTVGGETITFYTDI
jgi:hypothetical protein